MGEEESSAIESTSTEPDQTTSSTSNKTSQPSLETHSTPDDYASNLWTLNNPGAIHLTPDTNSTISSISHQQYHGTYSVPYPQMSSTRYPTATLYMSSSTNYPIQPSSNTLYHYQQQQTPYRTQQYDHPQ